MKTRCSSSRWASSRITGGWHSTYSFSSSRHTDPKPKCSTRLGKWNLHHNTVYFYKAKKLLYLSSYRCIWADSWSLQCLIYKSGRSKDTKIVLVASHFMGQSSGFLSTFQQMSECAKTFVQHILVRQTCLFLCTSSSMVSENALIPSLYLLGNILSRNLNCPHHCSLPCIHLKN